MATRFCSVPNVPDIVQTSARAVASSELFLHRVSCSLRASFTGKSKEERLLRHVIFEAAASKNSDDKEPMIKQDDYLTFDISSVSLSVPPMQVLSHIDNFGWGKEWLMVVGGTKGAILDACVQRLLTSGLLAIHFREPFSQVIGTFFLQRRARPVPRILTMRAQPPVILELGSYVGYSAIRLGAMVQSRNGKVVPMFYVPILFLCVARCTPSKQTPPTQL